MGFWEFVFAVVVVSIVGGIVNNLIKARHGIPLAAEGCGRTPNSAKAEAVFAENEELKHRLAEVTDRLAVLERIVTDEPSRLAREIDALAISKGGNA